MAAMAGALCPAAVCPDAALRSHLLRTLCRIGPRCSRVTTMPCAPAEALGQSADQERYTGLLAGYRKDYDQTYYNDTLVSYGKTPLGAVYPTFSHIPGGLSMLTSDALAEIQTMSTVSIGAGVTSQVLMRCHTYLMLSLFLKRTWVLSGGASGQGAGCQGGPRGGHSGARQSPDRGGYGPEGEAAVGASSHHYSQDRCLCSSSQPTRLHCAVAAPNALGRWGCGARRRAAGRVAGELPRLGVLGRARRDDLLGIVERRAGPEPPWGTRPAAQPANTQPHLLVWRGRRMDVPLARRHLAHIGRLRHGQDRAADIAETGPCLGQRLRQHRARCAHATARTVPLSVRWTGVR